LGNQTVKSLFSLNYPGPLVAPIKFMPLYLLQVYTNFSMYGTMNIQVEKMRKSAAAAEKTLKALSNRHRLMLLCQLVDQERSVGELAASLNLRDSTVSQHLALLRKDRLVRTRREGQTIWYTLASDAVRILVETLYQIYCGPKTDPRLASKSRQAKTEKRSTR